MKKEQEQIKELKKIRFELLVALGGILKQPSGRGLDHAMKVYEKAKAMEANEVEKLVPVIIEKSLTIYVERDSRIMDGDGVKIIIENQSIMPDQKAYSLAYDLVWKCFDDICCSGTCGHTRYMSSAGVRITFNQRGTTISATVKDIEPNE